ncbi:MAG: TolC family protein, partial [Kangiellaceae bacterium]|nr:TolC family protein [Kangiellaceae bacterium]
SFEHQLKTAGLIYQQSIGSRLPQLDLNLNKSRDKSILGISQSYQFGLGVNWEIDLWGRLANRSDAALAEYRATEFEFKQLKNQLVATLIRHWNQLATTNRLLHLEKENHAQLVTLISVQKDKLQSGAVAIEELAQTKVNISNSSADIASLEAQLTLRQNQLALLIGKSQLDQIFIPNQLAQIAQPPHSIPADVLARRPDIKTMFLKLESLDYQTRASYKALLPNINLSGNLFRSAEKSEALSNSPNLWSFVGAITQPLFYGGRLKAAAEIDKHNAQAHWWQYKKSVLNAITEVENSLSTEQALNRQIKQLREAKFQSQQVLEISKQKYRDGSINILDLVFVRQQAINSEARLIQANAAQMDNRILLALALGLGIEES